MTKESIYELQKIDCNCNDCVHLVRDMVHYNTVVAEDYDNQYYFFRIVKARRIRSARKKIEKDPKRGLIALEAALQLSFVYFPQRVALNYGDCIKFQIYVSFIPNTLQLTTQHCFLHRKDILKLYK